MDTREGIEISSGAERRKKTTPTARIFGGMAIAATGLVGAALLSVVLTKAASNVVEMTREIYTKISAVAHPDSQSSPNNKNKP